MNYCFVIFINNVAECHVVWFIVSVLGTDFRRFESYHSELIYVEIKAVFNLYRYCRQNVNSFKKSINCFSLFEDRIVEGIIYEYNGFFLIDLGFKCITNITDHYSANNLLYLNNIKKDDLFLDIYFDYNILKCNFVYFNVWYYIKKAFYYNCFILGRFLNSFSYGFSIGVCGFIGFLTSKDLRLAKYIIVSIFNIRKISFLTKKFLVSQKPVRKLAYKILLKLSSKRIDFYKN